MNWFSLITHGYIIALGCACLFLYTGKVKTPRNISVAILSGALALRAAFMLRQAIPVYSNWIIIAIALCFAMVGVVVALITNAAMRKMRAPMDEEPDDKEE